MYKGPRLQLYRRYMNTIWEGKYRSQVRAEPPLPIEYLLHRASHVVSFLILPNSPGYPVTQINKLDYSEEAYTKVDNFSMFQVCTYLQHIADTYSN